MDLRKRNAVKVLSRAALAAAAAGLFATATVGTAITSDEANVHCTGVNACKGKGECRTATNDWKGMNSCKGQDFISMTPTECAKKGGKVEKG
jgi:hypothetical protein